ncbi:MAG: lamin tail domain-containing protein [Bacteroidales bacterium]|nr:lamin tail domain-containing protein [Bacteroidales bacterium]
MRFIVLSLLLLPLILFSQVEEKFSDGNFTSDPEWKGDTTDFKITNSSAIPPEMKPALQLYSENSDTSFLVVENNLLHNTEWRFWVKLSFNTSANNFVRVYLVSDNEYLEKNVNGYYVQLGGLNDSIGLFKQTGDISEQIITGTSGYTGNSLNVLRIKVLHDDSGNWTMFSDNEGGYNFQSEGTGFDITYSSTDYFGIFCKYTSSNAQKIYFDDFYAGQIIIDTIAPVIEDITVNSQHELIVKFNEEVDLLTSQDTSNYFCNNGIGYPSEAVRNNNNLSEVCLCFENDFTLNVSYTLTIYGIGDLSGNIAENQQAGFVYFQSAQADPFDVVINEIMTDINPAPINLPEADYLELFNRTDDTIDMTGWSIIPRTTAEPVYFSETFIFPDSFLIITHNDNSALFDEYGMVMGLPSFSMNNEGNVQLFNKNGTLIHSINYFTKWYNDPDKEDGGWSLEQIDPTKPCIEENNWSASFSEMGGTPGKRNSVLSEIILEPAVEDINITCSDQLILLFNQKMEIATVSGIQSYFINKGIGYPVKVIPDSTNFRSVTLFLGSSLEIDSIYTLIITDSLENCIGDYLQQEDEYSFAVPADCYPFDITFSEIMVDPSPPRGLPEYEYIELYNRTSSWIRIDNWYLLIGETRKNLPAFTFSPKEYMIITDDDAQSIFNMYARTIPLSSLGLTNSGSDLFLYDGEDNLLSGISYDLNSYKDPEKEEGGWSLEAIYPDNPCVGIEYWSATTKDKGGTPGEQNSIYSADITLTTVKNVFSFDPSNIEVTFNEIMDSVFILNPVNYSVDNGIGSPVSVLQNGNDYKSVMLEFYEDLNYQTVYNLIISEGIINCIGSETDLSFPIPFGVAEDPVSQDIIINEVLFNPGSAGVDFVEIYNRSEKIIRLEDVKIGSVDYPDFEPPDTTFSLIPAQRKSLLPGEFLVLTEDPINISDQYMTKDQATFCRLDNLPSYNNDEGHVILVNSENKSVDYMAYSEEMHFPLLQDVNGVSLERISYKGSSTDRSNWHSASETVGFATPGVVNSQHTETGEKDQPVSVYPEVFSPDNDGYNDILNITYKFNQAGFTGSISIFDDKGRMVRSLSNITMFGAEGTINWDGIMEDQRRPPEGIYIILFEVFNQYGEINKYKNIAVLTCR